MTKIQLTLISFIFTGLTAIIPSLGYSASEFKLDSSNYMNGSEQLEDYARDGKTFLTSNYVKSSVTIWDAKTLTPIRTLLPDQGSVTSARFSPDGRLVVSLQNICGIIPGVHFCDTMSNMTVWNVASGKELTTTDLGKGTFQSIKYSKNGKRGLVLSPNQLVIFDAKTFKPLQHHKSNNFKTADFSPDGESVLFTFFDADNGAKPASLLDLTNGISVAFRAAGGVGVRLAKFSPDGSTLFTLGHDYVGDQELLTLWDANTLKIISEQKGIINSATFSADSKSLFVATDTLHSWNLSTDKMKLVGSHTKVFKQYKPIWVHDVLVSPNDERVISLGDDGSVIAWKRTKK